MLDAENDDFLLRLVDSVQDAVGAAPRGVDAGEVAAQLLADATWVLDKRSGKELDYRRRNALGQSGLDGSDGRWSQNEFIRFHERRARTASAPRTTSPAA